MMGGCFLGALLAQWLDYQQGISITTIESLTTMTYHSKFEAIVCIRRI